MKLARQTGFEPAYIRLGREAISILVTAANWCPDFGIEPNSLDYETSTSPAMLMGRIGTLAENRTQIRSCLRKTVPYPLGYKRILVVHTGAAPVTSSMSTKHSTDELMDYKIGGRLRYRSPSVSRPIAFDASLHPVQLIFQFKTLAFSLDKPHPISWITFHVQL